MNVERMTNQFCEMVKIYSPSLKEREMADYLINELEKIGLEVIEDNAGEKAGGNSGNIIGILEGELPCVMFSSHMDTVEPSLNIEPIIEDGIIKSKGNTILGADDKAGIAIILEMLKTIKEENIKHPKIMVIFSIAEEIGLIGAKYFDNGKYKIDYGFILDSGNEAGFVVNQAPYHSRFSIEFIGKAAHAGIEPEKGINAMYVASQAISKMKVGRIDEETSFNIGIVSGGKARNIIMENLKIDCEARSFSEEKLKSVIKEVIDLSKKAVAENGAELKYKVEREYDGFKIDENSEIMQFVKNACQKLDYKFIAKSLGGGSDTNVYNSKGIKTINLGMGMTKVHTKDEYIKIKDMEECTKLLIQILKEIR